MKQVNILFTGIGRRIELIKAFREAALIKNVNLKIFGADLLGNAPALSYCDYTRKVCGMREDRYIDELIEICKKDNIDLIIPTIDTDLLILSKSVRKFKNTKVLISDFEKIKICRDKNLTTDFFIDCGCKAPKTINDYIDFNGKFPCFIKPKDGSSSVNTYKVEKRNDLVLYAQQIKEYVIQEYIDGTEYTVDVFCDFDSKPIYIIPRKRLQVRAGEVLKTEIDLDRKIIDECERIVKKFKPIGPITIQLIREKTTGNDYYIEINPRFGGGAPLSMKAGAKSCECILGLLTNNKVNENRDVADGLIFSRFDDSVCININDAKKEIKGVILDLDDTLYGEKEYVKSGFKAVEMFLKIDGASDALYDKFLNGEKAIDVYLNEIGKKNLIKECIDIYRNHIPAITLYKGVNEAIIELKNKGIKVGIITDGRPNGQRNKIIALGLDKLIDDIIITDELGGEQFRKPCDIAFRIMQRRWKIPFENIIYVGDNLHKDFQAPKQLGMQWKYIQNKEGLY